MDLNFFATNDGFICLHYLRCWNLSWL